MISSGSLVVEFVRLVELLRGTVVPDSIIRYLLEKRSSRPPPNSVFSEIVNIKIGD